ncbi:MAG TPA: lysylphosphatidylglycerol synthase domain-containing protein [Gemmatimonadales bacterium]|jgi:uncharacterized membrane protein YbhN (UPF0104 family)
MIGAWLAALALVAADLAVRAARLQVLLGAQRLPRLGGAVAVNALGDAASAATPARLGGEPARFLALRRRNTPGPAATVALATERVVDMGLAALVTLGAAGLLGTRGFGDVADYAARFAQPAMLPWVLAVVALLLAGAVAAVLLRSRFPRADASVRDALAHARSLGGRRLALAVALTALSMAARVAVLPVLLWGAGALGNPVTAAVGSFALIYAQLLLPTPAGAGGVELGFVLGVAPALAPGDVAGLLITWRVFTLAIPAGLGAVVFVTGRGRAD